MTAARAGTALLGSLPRIGARLCPLCETYTDQRLCPDDRTATLLADAPGSDPHGVGAGSLIASRYVIEERIGSGGFALVFRARNVATGQGVALKLLDSPRSERGAELRRFFREARVTSSLRHANTVRVFDFGQEDDGLLFIAMELLTGRTLSCEQKVRLAHGTAFEEQEALRIAIEVTHSLSEAHAQGLVHRDLTPRNVFLHEVAGNDPTVKVLDFGLVQGGGRPLTQAVSAVGTASYMSPEQTLGQRLTASSDLYSLGVTLFWMVAGEGPFRGATPLEVMAAHVREPFPDVRSRAKVQVSAAFAEIVACATQKSPEDRFKDARSLRLALERCLAESCATPRLPHELGCVSEDFASTALRPVIDRSPTATTMALDLVSVAIPSPAPRTVRRAIAAAILIGGALVSLGFLRERASAPASSAPVAFEAIRDPDAPLEAPVETVAPEPPSLRVAAPSPPRAIAPRVRKRRPRAEPVEAPIETREPSKSSLKTKI